jgi:hypothetical protein
MSVIKRLALELTPPAIRRAAGTLRKRVALEAREGSSRKRYPEAMEVPALNPKGLAYLTGDPVFSVPMERVRYPDGRFYTHEEHHFMMYYRGGVDALRRFYAEHQPVNMFEYHFLKAPGGKDVPKCGAPWFRDCRLELSKGEEGLGLEHGDQAHGPVTEQKLMLEARRLDRVLESIKEHGFRPEMGGYVRGFFMLRTDGRWVFTIRGGFHRTAAQAHLGYKAIDVQFYNSYPRFVEEADCLEWPMVKSGQVSQDEALALFSQFFRSP